MVLTCGIDPGLQGGYAMIEQNGVETHIVGKPLPTIPLTKTKRKYDHATISAIFSNLGDLNCYAVLEEQHAMPKQGVTSMFSIGYGFGLLKQCLVDFKIPHEVVRAKEWQKEFGISGSKGNTKIQALRICRDLFPNLNLLATERSKQPHKGIVDAALIAEFGRRRFGGDIRK